MSENITPHVRVEPASAPEAGAGSLAPEPLPEIPAAGASLFDGLASRLAAVRDSLTKDLEVPRWLETVGFRVFVRLRPLSPDRNAAVVEHYQKSKQEDWRTLANAHLLVDSCVGIYAVDPKRPDEKLALRPGDPDGPWPTFADEGLARMVGAPTRAEGGSAIATCRALYLTDADLAVAVVQLGEWSAATAEDDERGFPTP